MFRGNASEAYRHRGRSAAVITAGEYTVAAAEHGLATGFGDGSPVAGVQLRFLGGAIARVTGGATAFAPPAEPDHGPPLRRLRRPGEADPHTGRGEEFTAAVRQSDTAPTSASSGTWIRSRSGRRSSRVPRGNGSPRVMAEYDPADLFRSHRGILPAAS
ncbi:hypothetical protein [Streptomyces sp. TLI_105]|uniref:hypothetical protein n=1 Tax=Streptomyces sp. TLI_105 TaxID=1881019 RepID=UPI00089A34F8|nr:hypothetical protein [Streptomyces sp. TLI_105]SEB78672.1 hypothetical protein SAMN05428939_0709 [Streptomyces sp. TLI_105]